VDFGGQLLQYLFSGVTMGSIYALIALALVTTFNISGILNLAQGEYLTLGALMAITFLNNGIPLAGAFALAVVLVALISGAVERGTLHPARNAAPLTLLIITIGVSIILRGGALLIWGTHPYGLAPFSGERSFFVAGAAITAQSFWVIGLSAVALLLLYLFFETTFAGKAVRACVINRTAARLVGIDPDRMSLFSFIASGALGALAGIFIAPLTLATYDMGFMLGLKGFVAAIMGGLTSIPGAVLGGFLLGIFESFGAGVISSGLKDAVAIVILLIVLMVRPTGILGLKGERRA